MKYGYQPDELADSNIISDYHKLSSMFDLYEGSDKNQVLQNLMSNEPVIGNLVTSFSLSTNFTYDHFISLLYYLGLITIEKKLKNRRYQFKVPNQVIKDIYYDYYFTYLTNNSDVSENMISEALYALESDDESPLIQVIETLISETTADGNRYMIHFRENISEARYKDDNGLLDKAIADVEAKLDKDIRSLGEGKGVAVVFVGKNCKYHSIKKS